jgi:hypothetical protein
LREDQKWQEWRASLLGGYWDIEEPEPVTEPLPLGSLGEEDEAIHQALTDDWDDDVPEVVVRALAERHDPDIISAGGLTKDEAEHWRQVKVEAQAQIWDEFGNRIMPETQDVQPPRGAQWSKAPAVPVHRLKRRK